MKKTRTEKKTLFEASKDMEESKSSKNKCYSLLKDFVYLSLHNIILIFIIIISMMISGLFSIFYIIFSLYFLITSTSIYLGYKYYYPKAIKYILRITILVDITAQILYQAPFFEAENSALELIGLNKFVNFTIIEETSYDKHYEVNLLSDQLFLVLAKAFTYLFMSLRR